MLNAKWPEQRAPQARPTGFEFREHRQFDASVAGRTPRLSSAGISGSSPDGIPNMPPWWNRQTREFEKLVPRRTGSIPVGGTNYALVAQRQRRLPQEQVSVSSNLTEGTNSAG